jgi:hypothetical protein
VGAIQHSKDSLGNETSNTFRFGSKHNKSHLNITNNTSSILPTSAKNKMNKREDVSFLQDKKQKMYSLHNDRKKIGIDHNSSVLMSQSQLTSGNEGLDDFMQVSLGMKHIGKLILDLPMGIDDLKKISSEYIKNLGSSDVLLEEQIYLQYIEDHIKA